MRMFVTDPTVAEHVSAVLDRLLISDRFERFEDCEHLLGWSLAQVVDAFWPVENGWTLASVEAGRFYVLHVHTHPVLGVGVALIGAAEPGGGVGSAESWEALPVATRARNVWLSSHAQGATRLDILDQYVAVLGAGELNMTDEAMVDFLVTSPVFMDETTRMMLGLSDRYGPLLARAAERRDRWSRQHQPDAS